jgi:hypothetical protein
MINSDRMKGPVMPYTVGHGERRAIFCQTYKLHVAFVLAWACVHPWMGDATTPQGFLVSAACLFLFYILLLTLPCRLVTVVDAFLGMVNIDLLLLSSNVSISLLSSQIHAAFA